MNHKTTKEKIPNSKFRIPNSKNNSGASLLFVLAAMFLLLATGVSLLAAAGAGRGAMARQAEHNQLLLLDGSVQRNIMYSLQNATEENSLGTQIIWAAFEARYIYDGKLGDTIELETMEFDSDEFDVSEISYIRLNILQQDVKISEAIPPSFTERFEVDSQGNWVLDENGLPNSEGWKVTNRIPRTATVSMRLVVEVEITIGERTIVSEAEYLFVGDDIGLTDANPEHTCSYDTCHNICIGIFTEDTRHGMRLINGGGRWTIERRGVMLAAEPQRTIDN